ncbi:hypothetical protein PspLS_06768 [Pyricularia sp. CBS 133598]|nr:hypothetical protein PspLS_06768 [Pyricularia sp. CBS 133598]
MDAEPKNDNDVRYRSSSMMLPPNNIPQPTRLLGGGRMDSPRPQANLRTQHPSYTPNPREMSRSRTREPSEALFMNNFWYQDLEGDGDVEQLLPEDIPESLKKRFEKHIRTEPIKQESLEDPQVSRGHDSKHETMGSGRLKYIGGHDQSTPIDLTQIPDTAAYQRTDVVFLSDDEEDLDYSKSVISFSDGDEDVKPQVEHTDLDVDTTSTVAVVPEKLGKMRGKYIKLFSKRDKLKDKEAQGALTEQDTELLDKIERELSNKEKSINNNDGDDDSSDSDDDDFDDSDDDTRDDHVDEAENGFAEEDNDGNYISEDAKDEDYQHVESDNDDDDDYQPTKTKNPKKRKQGPKIQAPKSKEVPGPPAKKRKTKRPRPKRTEKQRNLRPISAQEWWEREYERNSEANAIPNLLVPNGIRDPNQTATWQPDGAHGQQVLDILKDIDPVNARAAMDTSMLLDEGTATTRPAQEAQLRANLKMINDSMVQKDARKEMSLLRKAMGSFGWGKCTIVKGRYLLRGMKTPLFNHQLVGVHFMLGKEFSPLGPYGGILADQMGLGKTVQMLACMSQNQGDGPTLIVAPAAAIEQWKSELKKHCDFAARMWHYSNNDKNQNPATLKTQKVVIASYQAIAKAFPSDEALRRISGMKLGLEAWREQLTGKMGDAFLVDWHRVVLDEAHAIKNHLSRTSKACVHLRSKHRWALSGTPIHNSIEELYPYMRFLRVEWAADMNNFKKKFGGTPGDDESENSRLAAVVPSLMIRRRVHDTFMGQPILRIPPTHPVKTISVELSMEEKLIYHRLEERFRDNLKTHIKQGVNKKKLRTYFTYLTRLRQCTSHPFLLEASLRRDFELEDIVWLRQQLAEVGGQTPLHTHISKWINDEEARRLQKDENGGEGGASEATGFGKSAFGGVFEMNEQLERIQAEKTAEDLICRSCTELPQDSQITEPCGHTFCKDCIEPVVHNAEASNREPKCPHCSAVVKKYKQMPKPGGRNKRYEEDTDGEAEDQVDEPAQARGKRKKKARAKKGPQPGDDAQGVQPRSSDITKFLEICDRTPDKPVTPSAKTTAIKMQVLEWLRNYPDDKMIIFTHWVPLARILGRVFEAEKIKFLYYFGSMGMGQRKTAVENFTTMTGPQAPKLLIASTRCGGQALNLTAANRVILVDLWWNTAVERQAFGRVHRIGQTKDTYYVKIVARKTIDERLLEMQDEKDATISATLQDGEHKVKPLTYADIRYLIAGDDDDNNFDIHRKKTPNGDATEDGDPGQRGEEIPSDDDDGNGENGGGDIRRGQKRSLGPDADTRKGIKRRRVPSKRRPKSEFRATNEESEENEGPGGSQDEQDPDETQGDQEPRDDPDGPDEPDEPQDENGLDDPEGADKSDLPRPSIEGGNDPVDTSVNLSDLNGDFGGVTDADMETEVREVPAPNQNPFVEASDSEED